jgi:iron complex transport system substrate-binding protein
MSRVQGKLILSRRAAAFGLLASASAMFATSAAARQITDAAGRTVDFADPKRIVSIGGAATETIFALGEGARIAAIDTTSTYPPDVKSLPNVGYMRALSAEGVLAVSPDLVLALEGSGPPPAITALEGAKIPFLLVPNHSSPQGATEKIDFIGRALGVEARAAELSGTIEKDLQSLAAAVAGAKDKPRVLFILSASGGKLTVAGENSSAQAMFDMAGAVNAISGFSGFKAASPEALAAAMPDAIVMMNNRVEGDAAELLLAVPPLAGSPAAKAKRIKLMEGTYLLGFGPRVAAAARELALFLHPDLRLEPV